MWKTCWAAAPQGPYPVGNVAVQTDLSLVFPDPARGAVNQSFRLTLRPDLWGERFRIRFSNRWGLKPVVIGHAYLGLLHSSSAVLAGTNTPLSFSGDMRVVIQPGDAVWSDGVALSICTSLNRMLLLGRKLAVSFHVEGESGPITWHATAMNTSYVSWPDAGPVGAEEEEFSFPFSVNSWFFVDAVDVEASSDTLVVVCLGDSITDGSNSTLNGEDRWPDALSRRAHALCGDTISVVNAGIGGNQVRGPESYSAVDPYRGGPSALQRAAYDVLSLSGVGMVVWLEGINDFHLPETTVDEVAAAMEAVATRLRAESPGIRIAACTLPPALGSILPDYGGKEQDEKRLALNEFIRTTGAFDAFIDFAAAATDPVTGRLRAEFVPNSTRGGEGDGLHPNRLGKLKMVQVMDVAKILAGGSGDCTLRA